MQSSFYVDDCLSSLSSERQVCEFQHTSCCIMKNAGMELRKWRGNCIASSDEAGEKTLGLIWDIETDCMSIAANFPVKFEEWTRRSLLKLIAAIFDPLGYITPFTISGKILLQRSWTESSEWDTPFVGFLKDTAQQWGQDLRQLSAFQVQRWIGAKEGEEYCLHLFTDASEVAYACCIYLCVDKSTRLIYSKGKVAPLKKLSCKT